MPIRNALLLMILISVCCFLPAQRSTSKSSTLLSIHKPIKASWKSMLETLHIHNYEVAQENFSKGFILTARQEYISGPLTESHIRKITQNSKLLDGDWVKAEYQYKIYIQFHSEKETLISVKANIRCLKRPFLGSDRWTTLNSSGKLENDLLTFFGRHLFGPEFTIEKPRPGFWSKKRGHVQTSNPAASPPGL